MVEGINFTDTKKFIALVKENTGYDFSNYAMTSFRQRIASILDKYNLISIEALAERISSDSHMFDLFIRDFSVSNTEMFRDPSLWKDLAENIMPKIDNLTGVITIWLPDCTTGEEIYSLTIMLSECGLYEKSSIYASFESGSLLNDFRINGYDLKKMELNKSNYLRYNEKGDFSSYYSIQNGKAFFNNYFVKNVELIKLNLKEKLNPGKIHLIIYRNKFCYFNSILQNDILGILNESLISGGYLVLGAKENILMSENKKHFKLINENEMIFKKTSK